MKQLSSWTRLAGVLLFVSTTILAGLLLPDYNHTSKLISESYAFDTPYGIYLRILGYIPSGICLAVFHFHQFIKLKNQRLLKLDFGELASFNSK